MLFVPKLVGKPGQADEVIEFFKPDSGMTETVNSAYVALKEVERPKFLPKAIVQMMKDDCYPRFTMNKHTRLWQDNDAKAAAKGFGVTVAGAWYWYQSWIDFVRHHCQDHAADYQ